MPVRNISKIIVFIIMIISVQNKFQTLSKTNVKNKQNYTIVYNYPFNSIPKFIYVISQYQMSNISKYQNIHFDQNSLNINFDSITISWIFSNSKFKILKIFILLNDNIQQIPMDFITIAKDVNKTINLPSNFYLHQQYTNFKTLVFSLSIPAAILTYTINVYQPSVLFYCTVNCSQNSSFYLSFIAFSNQYINKHTFYAMNIDHLFIDQFYTLHYETEFDLNFTNIIFGISKMQNSFNLFQNITNTINITNDTIEIQIGQINSLLKVYYNILIFNDQLTSPCTGNTYKQFYANFLVQNQLCLKCYQKCQTCFGQTDLNNINFNRELCISCIWPKTYLNLTYQNNSMGLCLCYPGLMETQKSCLDCKSNCLVFSSYFLDFLTKPTFMILFSSSSIHQTINFTDNLNISIKDEQIINYSLKFIRKGYYLININQQEFVLKCSSKCSVKFIVKSPQKILVDYQYRSLFNQQNSNQISNYQKINDYLTDNINWFMLIIFAIIFAFFCTSNSSIVYILFQLQQIIEFHKYINLTIPYVFKQYLQALKPFKFLDLSIFFSNQSQQYLQQGLTGNKLDNLGPVKLIYYQLGTNFYKNIISTILSILIIFIINVAIYWLFKKIPLQISRKIASSIFIRRYITIIDSFQTLVLPIIFFNIHQMHNLVHGINYNWIYLFSALSTLVILMLPFLVIIYIYKSTYTITKSHIYEDLLYDTNIHSKVCYISYYYNYLRRLIFAIILAVNINGWIQITILISIHLIHLFFICYILYHKLFTSKIKIFIRFINVICILILQLLILVFSHYPNDINGRIQIGAACVFISLFATVLSMIEVIVRVFQLLLFHLKSDNAIAPQQSTQNQQQASNNLFTRPLMICNIGDILQNKRDQPQQKKLEYKQRNQQNRKNQMQNYSYDQESQNYAIIRKDKSMIVDLQQSTENIIIQQCSENKDQQIHNDRIKSIFPNANNYQNNSKNRKYQRYSQRKSKIKKKRQSINNNV